VAEVCAATHGEELYLFAETPDGVTARFFGPTAAIVEDPATGSAAGPLGAYLALHGLAGMPGRVLVRQGEQVGRPSELHVDVRADGDSWRIRVGGGVHVVGHGSFSL
jgi:trans-2,3-dihydro-3-hydroxyanthranilate isomerase